MEHDRGAGEVHSHLSSQPAKPDKGVGDSGKFDLDEAAARSASEGFQRAEDRRTERVRGRAEELRERAGGFASQARSRAGTLLERAESTLEERGVLTRIQEQPLVAMGIAFGIGFLLAGSGDDDDSSSFGKMKQQLKGAIVGGVSAALSQQIRSLLEEQGGLGNLMENLAAQRREPRGGYDELDEDDLS